MTEQKAQFSKSIFTAGVIVASLGYFVDIYDLLLFSIVRVPSLKEIGYSQELVEKYGLLLINIQMIGMLIGGIFWGVVGDKKGRLSVLFGSIILYSLANIMNGFVNDVTQYAVLRFIAGIGLAGELGAGITLVSESLPKEKRGYGTMIVASIGVSGAVFAGEMYHLFQNWRICFFIGGALGLALLILRIGVYESGMFQQVIEMKVERGNFFQLFRNRTIFLKYLRCILIGLPTWYVIGILITFSPEFSKLFGIIGEINGGTAIMVAYTGITLGDFSSGFLSQILKSRKKSIGIYLLITGVMMIVYFNSYGFSATAFYTVIGLLGFGTGFWAVVITNAAEQFGTNIRATVATTVPNFIRGSLPIVSLLYTVLQTGFGKLHSAEIVGFFIILIPLVSLYYSAETFGKDLDYIE